jgi:hypothetical protein
MSATYFLHSYKPCAKLSLKASKKDAFNLVKFFHKILNSLKPSLLEDLFHFRDKKKSHLV